MKRRLLLAAGALALVALLLAGVRWIGSLSFFEVRRIELVGGHYLTPAAVARALALPPGAGIFEDKAPLEARVLGMAGVREARIARRIPGTLRVTIREAEAVALAERSGRLVLLDARGRVLPFDPTSPAADLPLADPDPVVAGVLDRVRETDPDLFAGIDRGSRVRQDVVLEVGGGRVFFRGDATEEEIRDLVLIRDLLTRERRSWRELDARFTSRVIVRGGDA
ncbi:MAG TPA: FtsQ-type POTRA domain-containing protein [Gemmatimonadales bacterium]